MANDKQCHWLLASPSLRDKETSGKIANRENNVHAARVHNRASCVYRIDFTLCYSIGMNWFLYGKQSEEEECCCYYRAYSVLLPVACCLGGCRSIRSQIAVRKRERCFLFFRFYVCPGCCYSGLLLHAVRWVIAFPSKQLRNAATHTKWKL